MFHSLGQCISFRYFTNRFVHTSAITKVFNNPTWFLHDPEKKDRPKNKYTDMSKMPKKDPSKWDRTGTVLINDPAGAPRPKRLKIDLLDMGSRAANKAFLSIISNGAPGFGKCLALSTTDSCYMFNCPEMTSRYIEPGHGVKINRVEHVLFTQPSWQNCGGLPGFMHVLNHAGVESLTIHGAPHVKQILDATKPYVDERLELLIRESNFEKETFEDGTVKITYIPIFTPEYANYRKNQQTAEEQGIGEISRTLKLNSVLDTSNKVAVAFHFQLKVRGFKIDNAKLSAYKVKPGKWVGDLVCGKTVTLDDGRIITPDDVAQEDHQKPGTFLVVDCPSLNFLQPLIHNKQLLMDPDLDCVVHMTDSFILDREDYQQWMTSFPDNTRHLVVNQKSPYVFHGHGIFKMQTQLNVVNPTIFPELKILDLPRLELDNSPGSVNLTEPYLLYHLKPRTGLELSEGAPDFMKSQVVEETNKMRGFQEALHDYQATTAFQNCMNPPKIYKTYPEIIFLGTSSSTPTRYRNVTGILVNINASSSIILDCGEGTYQQMFHLLGEEEIDRVMTNLKCIYLSHMHMDHHLGMITLLKQRRAAFRRKNLEFEILRCLAPAPLFGMYELYDSTIEKITGEYNYTKTKPKESHEYPGWYVALDTLAKHIGIKRILPFKVDHPMLATGLVFETMCGKKIVYSGDTLPCTDMVTRGLDADVLIHEATFNEALEDMALRKKHSTVSQAIEAGRKMRAKYTILTHFSARYSKYPIVPLDMPDNVIVAMDLMRLRWDDHKAASLLTPTLQRLYDTEIRDAAHKEYLRNVKRDKMDKNRASKVDKLQAILQS